MVHESKENEGDKRKFARDLASTFAWSLILKVNEKYQQKIETRKPNPQTSAKSSLIEKEISKELGKDQGKSSKSVSKGQVVESAEVISTVNLDDSDVEIVPSTVTSKRLEIQSKKRFVSHPLSLGFDYQAVYAAYYWKRELKKLEKKKRKALPHLSTYVHNKPFFPNFVDPVPPNHTFNFQNMSTPELTQIAEISSSNMKISPERKTNEGTINQDELVGELSDDEKYLLVIYFKGLCPTMLAPSRQCNVPDCHSEHTFPIAAYLEQQLLKNSLRDIEKVYGLILKFSSTIRCKYFPVFAKIFAQRIQTNLLKRLVRDIQNVKPISFECFIKALTSTGWSRCGTISFIIDNHVDSLEARQAILGLIGTTGQDVIHFTSYLVKIKDQSL